MGGGSTETIRNYFTANINIWKKKTSIKMNNLEGFLGGGGSLFGLFFFEDNFKLMLSFHFSYPH